MDDRKVTSKQKLSRSGKKSQIFPPGCRFGRGPFDLQMESSVSPDIRPLEQGSQP